MLAGWVLGCSLVASVPAPQLTSLTPPLPCCAPCRVGNAFSQDPAPNTLAILNDELPILVVGCDAAARSADILRHSGFMLPSARTSDVVPWIEAFLEHDFNWYFRLMVAAADHHPMDPSFVTCPITVVAGGFDVMTSMRDVVDFARRIDHAEVHVLHATHFVPLEFPDEVMAMLDGLMLRSDLAGEAGKELRARATQEQDVREATVVDLRHAAQGARH